MVHSPQEPGEICCTQPHWQHVERRSGKAEVINSSEQGIIIPFSKESPFTVTLPFNIDCVVLMMNELLLTWLWEISKAQISNAFCRGKKKKKTRKGKNSDKFFFLS